MVPGDGDKPPPARIPLGPVVELPYVGVDRRRGASTAETKPAMPAVRPGALRKETSEPGRTGFETEPPTRPGEPARAASVLSNCALVRMDGPEAGRSYELATEITTIGRLTDNDIVLEEGSVSRNHARIVREGSSYFIEDLGTRNGTFLQGVPVQSAELHPGDTVQVGSGTVFSFQYLDTAQLALMRRLYESSTCDGLTGVINKKHFQNRLAGEVAYCRRHNTDLGLVMLDIDHFKRINDEYGHPAGDAVLCQVATSVAKQIRTEDMLARVGGEEFAVLARGIALEGCAALAERLRAVVEGLVCHIPGRQLSVTISLGCASLRGTDVTAHVLIAMADERLYEAKRLGRNRVQASGYGMATSKDR